MKRCWQSLFVFAIILSSCETPSGGTLPAPLSTSVSIPFAVVVPMPTRTPLPTLSGSMVLDSEKAVAYSYGLLLELGLETGLFYDNANYIPVHFSDGSTGAFIAFGFSGPTRGYQFLYQLDGNEVASVQLVRNWADWGIRSFGERAPIEAIALVPRNDGQPRWMLKVTGASHHGTGLSMHGYFEILDVSDGNIRLVFSGQEVDINFQGAGGWHREYQYEYTDLDGDSIIEIIERGEECGIEWDEERHTWAPTTSCETVDRVYRFNGIKYVQEP